MPREAIWSGSISFGLVSIPVSVRPAEARKELSFSMVDKRDMARIGYKKINKNTGEEVSKEDIVKAYEIDPDKYVIVTDEDFQRAARERTQRIDIAAFVDAKDIDPAYFDKPYFLEPSKKSEKAYALLREAMKRTGKAGIATMVMTARQHLAAVLARGPALTLELLRFQQELRDPLDLHLPDEKGVKLSEAELKMAERLIADLEAPWKPEQYKDEYAKALLAVIKRKAAGGKIEALQEPETEEELTAPADIMELLKKSVAHVETGKGAHGHRGRMLH